MSFIPSKKIYIADTAVEREKYRLVININESTSLGVDLSLAEIKQLISELNNIVTINDKVEIIDQ